MIHLGISAGVSVIFLSVFFLAQSAYLRSPLRCRVPQVRLLDEESNMVSVPLQFRVVVKISANYFWRYFADFFFKWDDATREKDMFMKWCPLTIVGFNSGCWLFSLLCSWELWRREKLCNEPETPTLTLCVNLLLLL